MKIKIFSDTHFEFHRDGGVSFIDEMADSEAVAVIAGDMTMLRHLSATLAAVCSKFKHVVYVPGNHELYGFHPMSLEACRKCAAVPNLSWLNNSSAEIDGRRFVGSTLWFPMPPPFAPKHYLNDYKQITAFEPWVYEQHEKSLRFLEADLQEGDILVTHHFPFSKSVSPRFLNSSMNAFFYAGQAAEDIVALKRPALAIHGHTHGTFDYVFNNRTRAVCNPLGYLGENPMFNPNKTIEV